MNFYIVHLQERLKKLREAEAVTAAAIAADPSLAAAAALSSALQSETKIPLQLTDGNSTDGNFTDSDRDAADSAARELTQTAAASDAVEAAQQCEPVA